MRDKEFDAWSQSLLGAARLLGAAHSLRGENSPVISKREQAAGDAWKRSARTKLGNEAFEKAWAEGQAMTLEEATALALQPEAEQSSQIGIEDE